MPSVKILQHPNKTYKDGTVPIMLRVILPGEKAFRVLDRINPKHWNEKQHCVRATHPDYRLINERLDVARRTAENLIRTTPGITARQAVGSDPIEEPKPVTVPGLLAWGKQYTDARRDGRQLRTAEKYDGHLTVIGLYLASINRQDIPLDEVDDSFVTGWRRWEVSERGNSPNTIAKRFDFIKTLLHSAHRRGVISVWPCPDSKVAEVRTRKPRLTRAQLDVLRDASLPDRLAVSRDCFLLQYYLYGARISDVLQLQASNISHVDGEGRAVVGFVEQKTGAVRTIRLHAEATTLLQSYRARHTPGYPFLLPLVRFTADPTWSANEHRKFLNKAVESASARVNKDLKDIAKACGFTVHLTTHVARHTFARLADETVADKRKIAGALGHTRFAQTENYLDDLRQQDIDAAMDEVFAAFRGR
ncbi:site-specific integrase [Spirosoma sordidisoli]|uniref:Tyr recombinase domain-containing protein n=1 Tax=Spirosoma sordidisoli TaxID=2502893 RepID=A0A4Q2URY0_9BACT|nr:site-specific integrase [Spirosoma sordidisoli]RYC69589.1 hypothetical protein EQG79_13380 [Spirosoma sordidisoli]